jgi:hypothetical protein
VDYSYELGSNRDLMALLEEGLGVAILPCSTSKSAAPARNRERTRP